MDFSKNIERVINFCLLTCITFTGCSRESSSVNNGTPNPGSAGTTATGQIWITKADQSVKLQQQSAGLTFTTNQNTNQSITVDDTTSYQTVDGFGFALTEGSCELINSLSPSTRTALLNEFFGSGDSSIGVSYIRISIGASDLSSSLYSYDDMPAGQADTSLSNFSLSPDSPVIKVLKDILAINPALKIIATPWSAPVWMKDNNNTVGGSLQPQYYSVYANYFVKYIQAMQQNNINITAVTPQNEPLYGGNNPSMVMDAPSELVFVRDFLGPAFKSAGIGTKIIIYDHNCDNTQYASSILSDAVASQYIDGSAFHLYAGNVSALGTIHNAFPNKNVYMTEYWTGSNGSFSADLLWHVQNVVIGTLTNFGKAVIEWNLASDPAMGPHTVGGCTMCQGAVTISGAASYTKNVSFYIIAHASKFIPANSVRVGSTQSGNLSTVAFKRPDGKIALIIENSGTSLLTFNISYKGNIAPTSLDGGAVATYIF